MYNVSEAYKLAVSDSHRKSKMRAVLTVNGTAINLDDSDIIKDSVYITNQCTNNNEFEFGCTYSAECGITIKSAVDRYSLYDAELKLYWSLWTGEAWEEIPLGVFIISEPKRINDKISIKALDRMTLLDVNVDEDTFGTLPQIMTYLSDKLGIELAQTEEEFNTLPNAEYLLSIYSDTVDTYRDVLAYICMINACFAIFDREGKLKLVPYATEASVSLDKRHRFANASFSDYTTKFNGVKCRFIAIENYAPYEYIDAFTDGLVLDMGDIPILRGLPETKNTILENVYNVLKNVVYTPFELQTLGNPALDLGDYVENINVGKDNKSYLSPITYYYWTYRGKHKLRAVGGNPKLANVNNKQNKQLSNLEGSIATKTVVTKEYRNADVISFQDVETEIANINYSAVEDSRPIFILSLRLKTDLDGIINLQFYTDAIADTTRRYRKYLSRGEHIVTIADIYSVENNNRHTISVKAFMEYFESDMRLQDKDRKTHNNFLQALADTGATVETDEETQTNIVVFPEYAIADIDTTIPTATIKKNECLAILYGQGIDGSGRWDGTLNFTEDIIDIPFATSLDMCKLVDNIVNTFHTPTPIVFTDAVSMEFNGGLTFEGAYDYINWNDIIVDWVFNTIYAGDYTFDEYVTTNNNMFALKTIYTYESAEETIDTGKMCSVAIDYSGLTVESVVVNNG